MKTLSTTVRAIVAYGTTAIVLSVLLVVVLAVIILSTIWPEVIPAAWSDNLYRTVILLFLAELLFHRVTQKQSEVSLSVTGITGVLPRANGDYLVELFSSPGEIFILNAWIYNMSELAPVFRETLEHERTRIHLHLIDPASKHIATRAADIGITDDEARAAVEANRTEIVSFLRSLPESRRSRVKVFTADYLPKFCIYARNRQGIVGLCLPMTYAIHGPQIQISGDSGTFSSRIWAYVEQLKFLDVTAEWCRTANVSLPAPDG